MSISKNKKIIIIFVIFILLAISFIFLNRVIKKPLKGKEDIVVTIEDGDSFYTLLSNLQKNNQIKFVPIIKVYVKITNNTADLKPGEYKLHNNMSVKEIITVLNGGTAINMVNFTVPEGFNIDEIANKLEIEGICTKDEFIHAVATYELPSYVKESKLKRYDLEGFLFPDTYKFSKQSDPIEVVNKMVERFEEVWTEILKEANIKVKDEDIEKVITIASMIEKEARVDEERVTISSVIYNRLNINMKLQIDATVIYALGSHVDTVLNKHLEVESPYNTYLIEGLPVGAISNPGAPSIFAALKPENTDYLFYVLQKDDKHYFTNSDVDFMNKLEELGY